MRARHYVDCMVDINEYLAALKGAKASDNIGEKELKEILLNGMPNGQSNQSYMQGFCCETIPLKYVNMFERMEISETIYEGFLQTS